MSAAVAALPETIEEWTQEQRDSLLVIARRSLAGYGKFHFSREFIARHVDDFVQDALLQAWVSQQDPEAEALRIYNPAGFVSFKVIQLALDKAKGEKRRLDRAAPEPSERDEGAFEAAVDRVSDPVGVEQVHELAEHLQATKLAMAQVPERQRIAFVKCQLEGRSQTEVAEELSRTSERPVTRKAVERLVANARVSLSVAFSKVASGAFCDEQQELLRLVDSGKASAEQEREAHAHLKDCPQCAQVRAFGRFERDAGLAAITLPGLGAATLAGAGGGFFRGIGQLAGAVGERARELVARVWPAGGGVEPGGVAVGTATTTKAIVALCVAAGGAGGCVKVLTTKQAEPARAPTAHQAPKHSGSRPAVAAAASPSASDGGEASAPTDMTAYAAASGQPQSRSDAHDRARAPEGPESTAHSQRQGGSPSAGEAGDGEFGFEGASASAPSTPSPQSTAAYTSVSSAEVSSEPASGYDASSGGDYTGAETGGGEGASLAPAPTSSSSSGSGQAQQEFGLGG